MCYNCDEVRKMTTVYDVIAELRDAKNWSTRRLAQEAGIPPTTLDSILSRKPQGLSIERLKQIAGAFGLEWLDLFEYGRENLVSGKDKDKVNSYIKEEELPYILEQAFMKAGLDAPIRQFEKLEPTVTVEDNYRQILKAMIDHLNETGLQEAMFVLMPISRNSDYQQKNNKKTGV